MTRTLACLPLVHAGVDAHTREVNDSAKPVVQIVLFDGFDPLDAVAPYEVFWEASVISDGRFSVRLVSSDGARDVVSGSGELSLHCTQCLDPHARGIIVVPGASGRIDSLPQVLARAAATRLAQLMQQAFDNPAVTVAAVCGGSLLLTMAGLLEGRNSVTHHLGMEVLRARSRPHRDARSEAEDSAQADCMAARPCASNPCRSSLARSFNTSRSCGSP